MGKRTNRQDNRPQTSKGREVNLRVRQVQGLRFSNAAGPIPSGARYDRNAYRSLSQRGMYEED